MTLEALRKQFIDFLDEAHRLKELYASELAILVGLETEFVTPLDVQQLEHLLEAESERIEYVVGSVHHVNEIAIDFDRPTYDKAVDSLSKQGDIQSDTLARYLCAYFNAQYELLERIQPEVVGHFDLCRLYTPELQFRDFPDAWRLLERNVQYAIGYGALFEINAAAFRKGWPTAYPGEDVTQVSVQ